MYPPGRGQGRRSAAAARVGHAALPAGAHAARARAPAGRDPRLRRRAAALPGARRDPRRCRSGSTTAPSRSFPAYRVQHSSVLGPTKGGVRYDDGGRPRRVRGARDVDDLEVRAPAPALRRREGRRALQPARALARRARRASRAASPPSSRRSSARKLDIPAPDMATNEQTMAWMMDTYSMQKGYAVPEIVTGKPVSIGGSLFRHEATGAGVVMVIERACERLGWNLAEQRCVVQGFGNVGGDRRDRARTSRARRVVAVSDVSGGVFAPTGLDIPTLHEYVARARLARGLRPGASASRTRSCSSSSATCSCSPRARTRSPARTPATCAAGSSPRARTARPRSTATRSSPSAASRSCPTCSRTPAASPSRTSSGCRTSAGSSGTATRSAAGSPTSSATPSTASGTSSRGATGISLRDAALVAGIREVAAALEARGIYP